MHGDRVERRSLGNAAAAVADDDVDDPRRRAAASAVRAPSARRGSDARRWPPLAAKWARTAGRVAASRCRPRARARRRRAPAPGRSRRRSRAGRSSGPRRSAGPSRRRRGGAGRAGTNSSRGTASIAASTRSSPIPRRRSCARPSLERAGDEIPSADRLEDVVAELAGSRTVTRPRPERTTPARSRSARKRLTLSREVPASWARSAWFIRIVTSPAPSPRAAPPRRRAGRGRRRRGSARSGRTGGRSARWRRAGGGPAPRRASR